MASSSPKILLSRRALQTIKPKHPIHFTFPKTKFKPTAEIPWPKSIQIAGYTAVALSIPYTFSVIVAQSPYFRDFLEGECMNDTTGDGEAGGYEPIGRKIVKAVRWYWGVNDKIPYVELLERKKLDANFTGTEYSLENENSLVLRMNQEQIEKESNEDVKVVVETVGGVIQDGIILKGNLSLSDQLLSPENINTGGKLDSSRPIIVTIEDKDITSDGKTSSGMNDDDDDDDHNNDVLENGILSSLANGDTSITKKEINNLAAIHTMWNYFPPSSSSNDNQSQTSKVLQSPSSAHLNSLNLRIEELEHDIAELQKLLIDPMCTRDRDDMDNEMKVFRSEMNMLKREKRKANLKRWIPF